MKGKRLSPENKGRVSALGSMAAADFGESNIWIRAVVSRNRKKRRDAHRASGRTCSLEIPIKHKRGAGREMFFREEVRRNCVEKKDHHTKPGQSQTEGKNFRLQFARGLQGGRK